MGWRFVEQPNGLLARFSEVVDHFTDFDMTDEEAINLAVREHSTPNRLAEEKVKKARSSQGRFSEAIEIIRTCHGQEEANAFSEELTAAPMAESKPDGPR